MYNFVDTTEVSDAALLPSCLLYTSADAFDRIRVGSRVYSVDDSRNLRTKQTFVVSEVQ